MPQIVNTNIASLNAQRNLNRSQTQLGVALQRLSSGLRINSAKDDAAGLAISDRFTTQIRGLNQAARNASDGISLSQTAESALSELTVNLQRIRELAVQSANSTNSSSDRAALNQEVSQRLAEIDRISSQTSFNGQKILDGTFGEAQFQIGANAGEIIKIDLSSSLRQSDIGAVASTTSTTLGNDATGGNITFSGLTAGNYSTAGVEDTAGSLSLTSTTFNFGTVGVDGTSVTTPVVANTDFATAHAALVVGTNVSATVADGVDFSGVGDEAQFDVTDGTTTVGITLNQNLATDDAIAAEIQAQLQAVGGDFAAATVTSDGAGNLTFTHTLGESLQIVSADVNSIAAGIANDSGIAGANIGDAQTATFTVDGTSISLVADNDAGIGNTTTELGTALDAAFGAGTYTVADDGTDITITKVGSASPVVITVDESTLAGYSANLAGIVDTAGVAGATNTVSVFDVDGHTITLNDDFVDFDDLASGTGAGESIQEQLDIASAGTYSVTNTAGAISITRTDLADNATVDITNADTTASLLGFANATGTAGATAVSTTNIDFSVDGQLVSLIADHSAGTLTDVAAEIEGDLTGYTVTADVGAGTISVENDTVGSAAVVIADAVAGDYGSAPFDLAQRVTNANTAGYAAATGTDGGAAGIINLAAGDLTLQAGDLSSVSVSGDFADVQALVDHINSNVSGVFASDDGGKLKLQSDREITIGGTQSVGASTTLEFAAAAVAIETGSLATTTVATVDGSNDTIVAIDSALTRVSSLRSTFGAIQSRFESTIANLTTTSENLSAARSRILDADFAAETAALTRAQILQQAGISILSQANSLPQLALSLLQ